MFFSRLWLESGSEPSMFKSAAAGQSLTHSGQFIYIPDIFDILKPVGLSQRHFQKGDFPSGNFPNVQFAKQQLLVWLGL